MRVKVKPCKDQPERENHDVINLEFDRWSKTCVRCIAMGFPEPKMLLLHKGSLVKHTDILKIDSVNVADGGLVESTHVFRRLDCGMSGKYTCKAENEKGSSSAYFNLNINGC